jgi:hypothetical protein
MSEEIVNKVASSGLITIDLAEFIPRGERAVIDLKDQLWQGLVLKEKDFRQYIKDHNWAEYKDKFVAVYCSTDAIIPAWAFMLVASALAPHAKRMVQGNAETLETVLFIESLQKINPEDYRDTRVVVKGCGDEKVPFAAYAELTSRLQPVVKNLMFGEPCSTVPVFKRAKE